MSFFTNLLNKIFKPQEPLTVIPAVNVHDKVQVAIVVELLSGERHYLDCGCATRQLDCTHCTCEIAAETHKTQLLENLENYLDYLCVVGATFTTIVQVQDAIGVIKDTKWKGYVRPSDYVVWDEKTYLYYFGAINGDVHIRGCPDELSSIVGGIECLCGVMHVEVEDALMENLTHNLNCANNVNDVIKADMYMAMVEAAFHSEWNPEERHPSDEPAVTSTGEPLSVLSSDASNNITWHQLPDHVAIATETTAHKYGFTHDAFPDLSVIMRGDLIDTMRRDS